MIKLRSLLFVVIVLAQFSLEAGIPDIVNFSAKDYASHSINYGMVQDSNGVMYIGNAYCVLEYDGQFWRKIPVSDDKSALSLAISERGVIYVGSSSEFGYLHRNEKGITSYISLKEKLPDFEIGEILDLACTGDQVYFRNLHQTFCYQDDSVYVLNPYDKDHLNYFLGKLDRKVVGFLHGSGLFQTVDHKVFFLNNYNKDIILKGIARFGKDTLLVTHNQIRLGQKSIPIQQLVKQAEGIEFTDLHVVNDREFLVGTNGAGLFHFETTGQLITRYTTEQGLQDNFIHSLFEDQQGNVWLAYNNGIGVIKWKSPIRYVTAAQGIEGMGYSGLIKQDTLFLGTSRGLFFLPDYRRNLPRQKPFQKIDGVGHTVYDIGLNRGELIICEAAETYRLKGVKPVMLSPNFWYGAWVWRNDPKDNRSAFVGTYLGVSRYEFVNGHWKFMNHVAGFEESSRVFEIDERGIIWVVQGNKGLYRVSLSHNGDSAISVINYADQMKTTSSYFNDIFRLEGKIFVTTYGGVYSLSGDSLVREHAFDELKEKAFRIRKYNENGIYAIYDDRAHLLKKEADKWQISSSPLTDVKSLLVGSAEFFYELAPNFHLIGTQNGFATYQSTNNEALSARPCLIRKIELLNAEGDSTLFHHHPAVAPSLSYQNNNIRITYAIPRFGENDQISYETQLFKNDRALHSFQLASVNFKEYTNLKEGTYVFKVRAKKGSEILGTTTLNFSIQAPWYRSTLAYAFYMFLGVLAIMWVYRSFLQQKQKLEAEKRRELEIKEKLHRAEKLELELKSKENELAYMALTYAQKKDLLSNLNLQINKISKELPHEEQVKLRSVKSVLSGTQDDESNWQNFQVHFDEKNDNFFQKLKEKEKRMSESNLLFCSYVRMGKPNKEIADLLNVSVAAVEKRKYRLKKKWNLPDDTSFTEFLRNL